MASANVQDDAAQINKEVHRQHSLEPQTLTAKKLTNHQLKANFNKELLQTPQLETLQPKQLSTDATSFANNKQIHRFPHEIQGETQQPLVAKKISSRTAPLTSNKELCVTCVAETQKTNKFTNLTSKQTLSVNQPQQLALQIPSLDSAKKWVWDKLAEWGNLGKLLWNVFQDSWSVLVSIASNPGGFIDNLTTALKQGLQNFVKNIWRHLQTGLVDWLTGGLGIQQEINLKSPQSIFSLALELLGVNWNYIRQKAVKHKNIGEAKVKRLETSFELFMTLKNQGLAGLWQQIENTMGNLKTIVIEGIKNMLIKEVITKAVTKLLLTLVPGSAIAQLAESCYKILSFLIEKAGKIAEVASTAKGAVNQVASGDVTDAAGSVELAFVQSIPVLIGFLARLVGIDNLATKVKKLLSKLKNKIDNLIDTLLNKAVNWLSKLPKGTTTSKPKPPSNNTQKPNNNNSQANSDKRTISVPEQSKKFEMYGKSHTLYMYLKNGECGVDIASRREYFENVLQTAIDYFQKKYGMGKNTEPLPALKTFLKKVQEYKYKIKIAASKASTEAEVINEMHKYLDRTANKLTEIGNKYQIEDLQKLAEDRKYSSGGELRPEYWNEIRSEFYGPFDPASKRNKAKLLNIAKAVAKTKPGYSKFSVTDQNHIYWCENRGGGLQWTPHFADERQEKYKPNLDHIVEVGKHWNDKGHNQTQAERKAWFNDTSNHQVICAHHNGLKSGPRMERKVGPNFKGPGE